MGVISEWIILSGGSFGICRLYHSSESRFLFLRYVSTSFRAALRFTSGSQVHSLYGKFFHFTRKLSLPCGPRCDMAHWPGYSFGLLREQCLMLYAGAMPCCARAITYAHPGYLPVGFIRCLT